MDEIYSIANAVCVHFAQKIRQLEKCGIDYADKCDKNAFDKTFFFNVIRFCACIIIRNADAMLELVVVIIPDGKDFTRSNLCD